MTKEQIDEIAMTVWDETVWERDSRTGRQIITDFTHALLAELAKVSEPAKGRFDCWSTNEGDSWYEHPADAELLYEVLGDEPKVGDEFEVMAGWISVQARYRISSKMDDDFEVECISHPEDNIPQPDLVAEIERLKAERAAKQIQHVALVDEAIELRQQLSAAQASEAELLKALEEIKLRSIRLADAQVVALEAIATHKARNE